MKKQDQEKLIKHLLLKRYPLNTSGLVFTFGKTVKANSTQSYHNYSEIELILKSLHIVHDANSVEDARIIICKTYKRGSKDLIAKKPPVKSIKQNINISEYYNGKTRNATNGQFRFKCKITINKDVWKQVEKYGANIGIKQIKNILLDDPILISQKSKQKGVRCIKPETYGWIFSTSYSLRLVAKNVHPTTVNPKELVFSVIEKGH